MNLNAALLMAGLSDTGRVRAHNEDAIHLNVARGLAILADGMGGHKAGEVASGMVTVLLGNELDRALGGAFAPLRMDAAGEVRLRSLLATEIERANTAVYQTARSQPQYAGMGTTLVMGVFIDNSLMTAHVGDSRLYRLRGGQFECLTRDHSLLQERLDSGLMTPEEARLSTQKNFVTRGVGVDAAVKVDLHRHTVEVGDCYLLCSDGLNDMVEDDVIGATLQSLQNDPHAAAARLIELANEQGGRDNVSAIVVQVRAPFPSAGGLKAWISQLMAR